MNSWDWLGKVSNLEKRVSKNGKVFYKFTLFSKETGFLKCTSFKEEAARIVNDMEIVPCNYTMRNNSWIGADGAKRYQVEFYIEEFEIVSQNAPVYPMPMVEPEKKKELMNVLEDNTVEWDLPEPPKPSLEQKEFVDQRYIDLCNQYEGKLTKEEIDILWKYKKDENNG